MQISNKGTVSAQCRVAEETRKREQATVAKRADAPTHSVWLKLRRLQASQWQPRRPKQPMNQNGIRCNRVSANREQCATGDDGKGKQRYPRQCAAPTQNEANRDACTQGGRKR